MTSRQFRLAPLLRLRRAQENLAAGDLARASSVLAETAHRADQSDRAFAGHQLSAGDNAGWMASVAARAALNAAAQDAHVEMHLAQQDVDAAGNLWRAARRTTKSLEHLETRHRDAVKADDLKDEQKTLDEFATRRPIDDGGTA